MFDLEQLFPKSVVFRVDEIVLTEKLIEPCRFTKKKYNICEII